MDLETLTIEETYSEIKHRQMDCGRLSFIEFDDDEYECLLSLAREIMNSYEGWDGHKKRKARAIFLAFACEYVRRRKYIRDNVFWDKFIIELDLEEIRYTLIADLLWQAYGDEGISKQRGKVNYRLIVKSLVSEVYDTPEASSRQFVSFFRWYYRNHPELDVTPSLIRKYEAESNEHLAIIDKALPTLSRDCQSLVEVVDYTIENGLSLIDHEPDAYEREIIAALGVDFAPSKLRLLRDKRILHNLIIELGNHLTPNQLLRELLRQPTATVYTPDGRQFPARRMLRQHRMSDIAYGIYRVDSTGYRVVPVPLLSLETMIAWPYEELIRLRHKGYLGYKKQEPFEVKSDGKIINARRLVLQNDAPVYVWAGKVPQGESFVVDRLPCPESVGLDWKIRLGLAYDEECNPIIAIGIDKLTAYFPDKGGNRLFIRTSRGPQQVYEREEFLRKNGSRRFHHAISIPLNGFPDPLSISIYLGEDLLDRKTLSLEPAYLFSIRTHEFVPMGKPCERGESEYYLFSSLSEYPEGENIRIKSLDSKFGICSVYRVSWEDSRQYFSLKIGEMSWCIRHQSYLNIQIEPRQASDAVVLSPRQMHRFAEMPLRILSNMDLSEMRIICQIFYQSELIAESYTGDCLQSHDSNGDYTFSEEFLRDLDSNTRNRYGQYDMLFSEDERILEQITLALIPDFDILLPAPERVLPESEAFEFSISSPYLPIWDPTAQCVSASAFFQAYPTLSAQLRDADSNDGIVYLTPDTARVSVIFPAIGEIAEIAIRPTLFGIRLYQRVHDHASYFRVDQLDYYLLNTAALYVFTKANCEVILYVDEAEVWSGRANSNGHIVIRDLGFLKTYCEKERTFVRITSASLSRKFLIHWAPIIQDMEPRDDGICISLMGPKNAGIIVRFVDVDGNSYRQERVDCVGEESNIFLPLPSVENGMDTYYVAPVYCLADGTLLPASYQWRVIASGYMHDQSARGDYSVIPIINLNHVLRDDYRRTIVQRALEFREQVRKTVAQRLAKALRENVQVRGFRPVSVPKAPPPVLISPVVEGIQHSDELMEAVVTVWAESHTDLCTAVHDFLTARDLLALDIHDLQLCFSKTCKTSELLDLVDAFEAEHPDHDRDDIALMLCCLSGQMPVPEDFVEEATADKPAGSLQKGEGAMIWEEWLRELRAMPANAPEWEKIPDFLASVEQIAGDKKQERESEAIRQKLSQALALLNEQCENGINFFQMNCAAWSAEACSQAECTALLEKIGQLREMLERYMELRGRPAENLKDEKSRREELEQLEQQVSSLHSEINKLTLIPNEEQTKSGAEAGPAIEDKSLADDVVREEKITQEAEAPTKVVVGDNGIEEAEEGEAPADSEDDLSVEETSEEVKPSGDEEVIEEESSVADMVREKQSQQKKSVPTEGTVEDREIEETEANEVLADSDMTVEDASELTGETGAVFLIPEPDAQRLEQEDKQAKDLGTDESDSEDAESLTVDKQESEETIIPLYPTQQAAEILLKDTTDENWHAFLWALIAEDDLSGAYWLSRSLDAAGRLSPAPDWLLAALQGSRWLSSDSSNFAIDLAAIATKYQPGSDEVQRLLALAAAANPSLIAPETGLMSWLESPADFPHLHDLVYAISQFTNLGKPLHPEDLMGTEGRRERESAISKVIADISSRLEMIQGRKIHTKIKRASDILRTLVSQGGDLHEVLDAVCKDDRDMVERICESLEEWQERDRIIRAIESADAQVSRRGSRPIVGSALEQIVRDIQGICQKARYWCELVIHEKEAQKKGNWLAEQAGKLQSHLQDILPMVESMADEQIATSQPAHLAASMICIRKSMEQLRETLHLALPESAELSVVEQDWMYSGAADLATALSHRLLLLPDILLDDNGQPKDDALPRIAGSLRDACMEERTLRDAMVGWLEHQDYRFLHTLSNALSDEDTIPYLEQQQGSRKALDGVRFSVTDAIEQAVVDGVISDEQRTQYSARVEEIKHSEILNFQPMHDSLRGIKSELDIHRQSRLASLEGEWQTVRAQLSMTDAKSQKRLIHFVETALEHGDTRLVEECIALIQTSEETKEIDEDWLSSLDKRETDTLVAFMDSVKPIEKWLEGPRGLRNAVNDISQGKTGAGFSFRQLPSTRLKESRDAILAWSELKRRGTESSDSSRKHIAAILSYLGFNVESYTPRNVSIKQVSRDLLHAQVTMSYGGDLALPQFGSQARGQYDILCLWERPGMATIDARLRELGLNNHSTIVFYLGRLTMRQRIDLIRVTRDQELALAMLDEVLLFFLARERDTRLPAFFLCTLPFVAINPYTPFQAGDVPKEMFFGRKDMVRELQRAEGSCMVYGGRQLGKSALLRQVAREFNHPEREQYAWVEDIKLVGDTQPPDAIWQRIREAFKELGLISLRVKTEKGDAIADYISRTFESRQCRVLFMFDEADNFLDADANDGFVIVEKLRQLMLVTSRRFKVAFTGLHNVQRFQGIPNQPLAHFGNALCVGPLEPDAAQKLVRQPLEALGYRFSENSSILRILSYTNYHPGLIQLFCRELIDYLHPRNANRLPPYSVTQHDVEAVYLIPQVRESIRERFDWTLALDPAYQTIAWAMIVDQMDARDGYAQVYSVHDIQKFVLDWWPQGFQNIDRLRGLLDEMRGLGVLARNQDGYYRLRSPNLVRLMGTDRDIEDRLTEVSERSPKETFESDSHHMPLDNAARSYSPLTYAQERSLMVHEFGSCLVFGSDGLGLSLLPSVFRKFLDPDNQDGDQGNLLEVPSNILTSDAMTEWLRHYLRKHQNCERLIAYQCVPDAADGVIERIESSQRFCLSRKHSHRQWMRVIFMFDPAASWAWLSFPFKIRHRLESSAEAVLALQRWNEVAIGRRLSQQRHLHIKDTMEVSRSVLEATNGWPMLLDILFERCERDSRLDPSPMAQSIREQLRAGDTSLNKKFLNSIGILGNTPHMCILEFIGEAGSLSPEYVTPDLIEDDSKLSQEECDAAVEYLKYIGCLEISEGELRVEPVVWDTLGKL